MKIKKLDHVNVRTKQLDTLVEWYTRVLGMTRGERPDFPFPGAWMYGGDENQPMVHLVGIDGDDAVGSEARLKLEHFAFAAADLASFEARLKQYGIEYNRVDNDRVGLIQVNVWDPDGNHIHLDFPFEE